MKVQRWFLNIEKTKDSSQDKKMKPTLAFLLLLGTVLFHVGTSFTFGGDRAQYVTWDEMNLIAHGLLQLGQGLREHAEKAKSQMSDVSAKLNAFNNTITNLVRRIGNLQKGEDALKTRTQEMVERENWVVNMSAEVQARTQELIAEHQRIHSRMDQLEERVNGMLQGREERVNGMLQGREERVNGMLKGREERVNGMLKGREERGNGMLQGREMERVNGMLQGREMERVNGMLQGREMERVNGMLQGREMERVNGMLQGREMERVNGMLQGREERVNGMLQEREERVNGMLQGREMERVNGMLQGREERVNGMLQGPEERMNGMLQVPEMEPNNCSNDHRGNIFIQCILEMQNKQIAAMVKRISEQQEELQTQSLHLQALQSEVKESSLKLIVRQRHQEIALKDDTKVDAFVIESAQDCHEWFLKGKTQSGVYTIQPLHIQPFDVFCEMTVDTGWTVIQRRQDGSQNFDQSWEAYKNGFGSLSGEFWLGLENIHTLTKQEEYTLALELSDWTGETQSVQYPFRLGAEESNYTLYMPVSSPAGLESGLTTAPFSTTDRDNDLSDNVNCAKQLSGGWWFSNCGQSNLNGRYARKTHLLQRRHSRRQLIFWKTNHALRTTMLKVAPAAIKS